MFSSQSKIKASLAAIVVLALSIAGARADEPTPAALNYANQILVDVGIKPSARYVVPEMLSGLDRNITATRPELKDSLRATLVAIEPEFVKSEQGIVAEVGEVSRKPDDRAGAQGHRDVFRHPERQEISRDPTRAGSASRPIGARLARAVVYGHPRSRPRGNEEEGH